MNTDGRRFGGASLLPLRTSQVVLLPHLTDNICENGIIAEFAGRVLLENPAASQNGIRPRTDSPFVEKALVPPLNAPHEFNGEQSSGADGKDAHRFGHGFSPVIASRAQYIRERRGSISRSGRYEIGSKARIAPTRRRKCF